MRAIKAFSLPDAQPIVLVPMIAEPGGGPSPICNGTRVKPAGRRRASCIGDGPWKAKYGGMDVSDAKRLKALEDENVKRKKLLADQRRGERKAVAVFGRAEGVRCQAG